MIHHLQNRSIVLSLLLICGLSAVSSGQQLPPEIVASPEPTPKERTQIDAFVDREIGKLTSPDSAAVATARTSILIPVTSAGATPGFLEQFADSLNQKMMSLVKNAVWTNPRVRLNAAIVTSKVAERAQNTKLAPITEVFLRDSTEAVSLWGMQSAKYVLPQLLIGGSDKLAITMGHDVVQAAKDHPSPPAIEEAYRTVLLNPSHGGGRGADFVKAVPDKSLQNFLAVPIAFFEYRVKSYENDLPQQPTADAWGSKFFVLQKVWTNLSAPQRDQVQQLMLGLMKGAAKQNVLIRSKELLEVVQQTGFAFQALADILKKNKMKAAAHAIGLLVNNAPPEEVNTAIGELEKEL